MNYDADKPLSSFAMTEPALNHVACTDPWGGHRMAYWQWGDASASHVVICVHGLSRQGRDFDVLARALVARTGGRLRVVCPDVVGRGQSDWLADPMGYQIPQYVSDMLGLLAQLNLQAPIERLDWVGTSMGGLIGLALAGQPGLPVPLHRLVLNDVGPVIQWSALQRIGQYLGDTGRYDSVEQAADALRAISATFGPHTREQWLALSRPMVKPRPDGGWALHYDPAIAVSFGALAEDASAQVEALLWQLYDQVKAQTLLVRGAQSDLLRYETALAMTRRGPKARLVEFEGVGHAPTFVAADQVAVVADFLLAGD